MQIADIKDPGLFQRLVRKLMICEYGLQYQVVDDSGGDGGLDGFNRGSGDLHAFYCPEKPEAARYREKFKDDLEKARRLRDEKQYAIKRFIFVTPNPLREPDQKLLEVHARAKGFENGINLGGEHLEVLLAGHMEILPQFPELSYPRIEQKLDRILKAVEDRRGHQGGGSAAEPTFKITDAPAQLLMLAVRAANKTIRGMAETENIIPILELTDEQYKDAVDELNALGLIETRKSANHPGGYAGVGVRPQVFVQVLPQVIPEVDVRGELMKLLQAFESDGGESVIATDILRRSGIPVARAQMLIDYLEEKDLVETRMLAPGDSLLFYYGRLLPRGKRILQGKDQFDI